MSKRNKTISLITALGFTLAVMPVHAFAQTPTLSPDPVRFTPSSVDKVDEEIVKLFAAFPDGGPQLAIQIENAIVKDPNTAFQFVAYVRNSSMLNDAQKTAAEQGFAQALKRLKATMGGTFVEPPPTGGFWLVIAALTGIGLCVAFCDGDGNKKVSPN